ncbi:pyridoxal phosphate-dependent aminotransferase family protein [Prolixibacteraceae bacterium JC049]|nr:pyridoxal phosphate-dependent aminotransferase family protein [Prolixibacteraceae bacterium JC049]
MKTKKLVERGGLLKQAKILKHKGLYPYFNAVGSTQSDKAIIGGKEVLMFGSNNYLGLSGDARIKAAMKKAIDKYGTSCTGSRFMNGTISLHHELEAELKDFLKKDAVIIFPTGFQVNVGVIPAVTDKNDLIFIDELNHASIIDGCRMSFARRVKYKHNNIDDLEQKLKFHTEKNKDAVSLIICDGIFSMDGDIAHLDKIAELGQKYQAMVMVDCAHAIGVIGENGSGTASHHGVTDKVDLIGGTFSKSLASVGGFVAGSSEVIDYLSHASRSYMFSASLPPASTAAALEALRIIRSDDSLRQKLWDNTNHAIRKMVEAGLDIGNAESPIIPVYIRNSQKTFMVAKELLDKGIYVNPVVAPGVKDSESLLRFSLTALHSHQQIDFAIECIAEVVHKYCNTPAVCQ